jgi:hypothetical protein
VGRPLRIPSMQPSPVTPSPGDPFWSRSPRHLLQGIIPRGTPPMDTLQGHSGGPSANQSTEPLHWISKGNRSVKRSRETRPRVPPREQTPRSFLGTSIIACPMGFLQGTLSLTPIKGTLSTRPAIVASSRGPHPSDHLEGPLSKDSFQGTRFGETSPEVHFLGIPPGDRQENPSREPPGGHTRRLPPGTHLQGAFFRAPRPEDPLLATSARRPPQTYHLQETASMVPLQENQTMEPY